MCASGVSVGFLGTCTILSILSWMARRRTHCDRVTIQLPERQYSDDVPQDDNRRRRCRNATLLSRNNFRTAQNDLHAITSRSAISFTKWSSKVIHTPLALNPCSLGVRVITVPSTSIFAARLSEADVHHTASFNSIRRPVHTSCSFHARAMHRTSAGDIATSQQLSAKSSNPMYLPSTGNLHFSVWHLLQNAVAGTSRDAPNTFAATRITLWHRTRTTYSRREYVVKLDARFRAPVHSDPRCHQHRRDIQGLHGVNDQVMRHVVESSRHVAIHHEDRHPRIIRLLHHSAQDEDHDAGCGS